MAELWSTRGARCSSVGGEEIFNLNIIYFFKIFWHFQPFLNILAFEVLEDVTCLI